MGQIKAFNSILFYPKNYPISLNWCKITFHCGVFVLSEECEPVFLPQFLPGYQPGEHLNRPSFPTEIKGIFCHYSAKKCHYTIFLVCHGTLSM